MTPVCKTGAWPLSYAPMEIEQRGQVAQGAVASNQCRILPSLRVVNLYYRILNENYERQSHVLRHGAFTVEHLGHTQPVGTIPVSIDILGTLSTLPILMSGISTRSAHHVQYMESRPYIGWRQWWHFVSGTNMISPIKNSTLVDSNYRHIPTKEVFYRLN